MIKKEIILVDKPKGLTSYDVIRVLKKKIRCKKMGHGGTLDPNASGLLIIGIDRGTKELKKILGLPKEYLAEIKLGIATDTGDITGNIVSKKIVGNFTQDNVTKILKDLIGEIELKVPLYSAIKIKGKPLYKYAREGKEIQAPVKEMKVLSARLILLEGDILKIHFKVGSGTYIRSLAEEIGRRLDTDATLLNLRRTSIGPYKIESAIAL